MKHLTNKTNQFFTISIFVLISLIFFSPQLIAKDLIEVVLDDNLNFETNNGNIAHTKIYDEFDTTVNFIPVNLFDLSIDDDFPVNIDGYFEENSNQVKLKINQSNYVTIKQNNPENVLINIPVANGKTFSLALSKSNPLSDDFQMKDIEGNLISFNEGLHYQGIVRGNCTSWASVSIFDNYVRALFIDYEGIYVLSAVNHFNEFYLLYNDKKLAVPYYADLSCGVDDELGISEQRKTTDNTIQNNRNLGNSQNGSLRIAIETDYALFENQGNFQNVYNYVTATLNEAAVIFDNEAINIELSELVAWDTLDIYDQNSTSDALQQFGSRRKNEFNGDLLHLFTSEKRDIGGLANVNVLGTCYTFYPDGEFNRGPYALSVVDFWPCAFGLYHYDVWTFVHEIGHNLGSRHTHFPVWVADGIPNQPFDNAYNIETQQYCDSQSPTNCYDIEVSDDMLQTSGGTIMSYFVANSIGASFYRGFGGQPGDLIRQTVANFLHKGCTDQEACNYNPNAILNDASCFYGQGVNDISIFDDFKWLKSKVNSSDCNNESIVVYQYPNQSIGVSFTEGSCTEYFNCRGERLYPIDDTVEILKSWTCRDCNGNMKGCTNTAACNYNPQATLNDGTCNFGDSECSNPCDNDCNCFDLNVVANTSNDVFVKYPWLANSINYEGDCNFEKITEYDFTGYQFIKVEFKDGSVVLYRNDGVNYCDTNACSSCFDVVDVNSATSITCWTCSELCDATGVVTYQICDGGQWYYLIETTDGKVIDPYNDTYNINFDYPNGAVVNFSYVEQFPSACEYADMGVQINCIEEVGFPCNYSNTGTVIYRNCNDGLGYYLIEMNDGRIFDPYNSSAVNFNYVVGDVVEFEYLPYDQTYCNLSDEAGIVTCIRSIACNNMGIVYYENCNSTNYLIQTTNGTVIYPSDQSGTGFEFQNGDIVNFGYSGTFASPCSEAAYGVYLTCIESVELPCTHTGEVISEECDGVEYILIDMGNGNVLDPYLSPTVSFNYVEGDFVEFAYMPFSFSACSAALESGIVTCIQNTCRNNVRIINSIPIPDGTHNNAKHIITYGEVHETSNVVLKAPRITFAVGFKVKAGATFKTISGGCN